MNEEFAYPAGGSLVEEAAPLQKAPFDYFGFSSTERFTFPDGVSFVELKVLNEGERRKYQNSVNRELKIARGTGEAQLKMRPGDDRTELLKSAITGWNLHRAGQPVAFNSTNLEMFLNNADPAIIDKIEKRVRMMNPWLLSDLTVEQIDEEIASLQELREKKLEEEQGN